MTDESGVETAVVDEARLDGLRVLGDDIVAEIIGTFLETGPAHVEAIAAAYGSGDAAEVRRHSHQLRGSSANLGFVALADALKGVEDASRAGHLLPAGDAAVRREWERLLPTATALTELGS